MDQSTLKAKLKSGELGGWYIFSGEEDYLKKYYLSSIRNQLLPPDDPFEIFNHASFDGAEPDFGAMKEAIKSPPMMAEYKLVEWRFAPLDNLKELEKNLLCELCSLKEECPYTVFAIMTTADGFDTGTDKKPRPLAKKLSEAFDIVDFGKSTEAQLISWLGRHFYAEGIRVDQMTLSAMLFRCGRSMEVLSLEVKKLSGYAKANGMDSIDVATVNEVTSSTPECDAFALSGAIIERNTEKAFFALSDLKSRRVEPLVIVSMLERTYSELLNIALLCEDGKSPQDIEKLMRMHRYRVTLYIKAAKQAGKERLLQALSTLQRIDSYAKSGTGLGFGPVEIFITQNI